MQPRSEPADQQTRFECLDETLDVDPRYETIARALCADLHNLGGVGASIAIAERGELALRLGVGKACADQPRRVSPTTRFRIGSITKVLTAATALSLVRRGELSLTRPVTEYLPELRLAEPDAASQITLEHLLSHTSGLPELDVADTATLASDQWFLAWSTRSPAVEPGRIYQYSNSGFALVGAVLERRTSGSYAQIVDEHVLEPIGLAQTGFDARAAVERGDAACGHFGREDARAVLDVESDFNPDAVGGWAVPAGAALSSAPDLVRLGLALIAEDSVLDDATRRAMLGQHATTGDGATAFYGLGIAGRMLGDDLVVYRHAGNTGDFAADLYIVPSRGFVLAILSNTGAHFRATAEAAFGELLDVSLAEPAPPSRPLDQYEGDYLVADWEQPIRVRQVDGGLRLSSLTLRVEELQLRPVGGDRFQITWPALDRAEAVAFVLEPTGDVWIRGRRFLGRRR